MGLPSITRGIGAREDFLNTTQLSQTNSNAPTHVTITSTTDGDIQTLNAVFNSSAVTNDNAFADYNPVTPPSTTTYPSVIIRHKEDYASTDMATLDIVYGDATSSGFPLTLSSTFITQTFTLTTGKTVQTFRLKIVRGAGGAVTRNYYADFAMTFKETLTLPTAIQPIGFRKQRNIVEIPIIQREGGQVQDLGSLTPESAIAGGLVNTTSGQSGWTNTYTADQWWQILYGLTLETGTLQADGNPTWQWFTTDNIQGKYFPKALHNMQVPGRVGYHEYALSLKAFNVLGETTANLVGVTY